MKRINNIFDMNNLDVLLLEAYNNAIKNKKTKSSFVKFKKNLSSNLQKLKEDILNHTYTHGSYHTRIIHEPKERKIYIANVRDRVVHWLIYSLISPIFEPTFSNSSFACRKGRGQHKASNKIKQYVRKYKYCLKFDIKKYFPTINHNRMKDILCKKIKDKNLIWLMNKVIDSVGENEGLPIGNLTSQIFGNIYRTQLDNFILQDLKAHAYVNYMDDGFIFNNSVKILQTYSLKIKSFLESSLKQTLSKIKILSCSQGIDGCGYIHYPTYKKMRRRIKNRIIRRTKTILKNLNDNKQFKESWVGKIAAGIGVTKHCNSFHFLQCYDLYQLKDAVLTYRNLKEGEIMISKDTIKDLLNSSVSIDKILSEEEIKSEHEKTIKIIDVVNKKLLITNIEKLNGKFDDENNKKKKFYRIDVIDVDTEKHYIIKQMCKDLEEPLDELISKKIYPIKMIFSSVLHKKQTVFELKSW